MYKIQFYLKSLKIILSIKNEDGRINSCEDEDYIIDKLVGKFGSKIRKPKIRMWYDILVKDCLYGWLPVNIKTTTTATCDNIGNLATCVYAYTDEQLKLNNNTRYNNKDMSALLHSKLKKKSYNFNSKKDYYFIVLNKTDTTDVIVNSIKGLTILNPNLNNLPFQVNWSRNREFNYGHISTKIKMFIKCLKKPEPNWKEQFMMDMRNLNLQ